MPRKKKLEGEWLPTVEAAGRLGISPRQLRALKSELKLGIHYLITSRKRAERPTYSWSVKEIEQYLSQPLEVRNNA